MSAATQQIQLATRDVIYSLLDEIDADLIEPPRLAQCVIDKLTVDRKRRDRSDRSDRRLTAHQALKALIFEAMFVAVCAQNLAQGLTLGAVDFDRLMIAWSRIETICAEAGV